MAENRAKALDLRSTKVFADIVAGRYRSAVHGTGIEWSDLRDYAPGDDVRAIDWRTSARTGRTQIKVFREERSMRIYFCLDIGTTMRFGSGARSKFDTMAETFSILAASASENGDPYGAILYDGSVVRELRPARGATNLALAKRSLAAYAERPAPLTGSTDALVRHLERARVRRSMIFILTDEYATIDLHRLKALSHSNDCVLVTILDSFERTGATVGTAHVGGADGDTYVSSSAKKRREFARIREERLDASARELRAIGVRHLVLDERDDVYRALYRFFAVPTHA